MGRGRAVGAMLGALTVLTTTWVPSHALVVERWAGPDRIATAVAVSQAISDSDGETVYVASATSFADGLAAAPAASQDRAPLLLTDPETLPQAVVDELQRLAPERIVVVGGNAAVTMNVEEALTEIAPVERLAGGDRYGTAVAISRSRFVPGPLRLYLATGEVFADALTAGGAAAVHGAPLLLTRPTDLPIEVIVELLRLRPVEVIVVGGAAAIGDRVLAQVAAHLPTSATRRLAGPDRYATAVAVNQDSFPATSPAVLLASGVEAADALVASPAAGRLAWPLLLLPPDCAPMIVRDEVARTGADRLVAIGGPSALSDAAARLDACPQVPPPDPWSAGVVARRVWEVPDSGAARGAPVVTLTFDDGPDPRWTPAIQAALDRAGVTATFFALGPSAERYPGVVRDLHAAGHRIAGHTWDHVEWTRLHATALAWQLDHTAEVLTSITATRVACVRPPYGSISERILMEADARGQATVLWSVDPQDWTRPGAATIAARVLSAARPGSVILLHDGGGDRSQTLAALPDIIAGLAARGLQIVPIG
jgi:peptidoglycan/xylan/chitin deacetylase (PgdA/CDA1 family)/putative cell wall-binding protein